MSLFISSLGSQLVISLAPPERKVEKEKKDYRAEAAKPTYCRGLEITVLLLYATVSPGNHPTLGMQIVS